MMKTTIEPLARLFDQMDAAYDAAAETHGFVCRGCRDNCCLTRFYHHTLTEYQYLRAGLDRLPGETQNRVRLLATQAVQQMNDADARGIKIQVMCPLNQDGRCCLYAHRPMICRLHGIPHLLRRPDGHRQTGPGCDDFDRQCAAGGQPILDRTPLYIELANIERALRQQTGFKPKIKMTIAQMILTDLF